MPTVRTGAAAHSLLTPAGHTGTPLTLRRKFGAAEARSSSSAHPEGVQRLSRPHPPRTGPSPGADLCANPHSRMASPSSPQRRGTLSSRPPATTGAEPLQKGKVGAEGVTRGQLPPPPPSLLSQGFGPGQGCATARAAAAPLRVPPAPSPRPPGRAAAPASRAPRGLPPHFSGRVAAVTAAGPGGRPGWGAGGSDHPRSPLRSRARAAPEPEARGARPPNAPLPRRERGRSPPSPAATAPAAPRWGRERRLAGGGCCSRPEGEEEKRTAAA